MTTNNCCQIVVRIEGSRIGFCLLAHLLANPGKQDMIKFCPLASSSQGNSVYLETPNTKILIDCGLSGKRTKENLAEIDVSIEDIDAILITHEHGDHIRGLKVLACKHEIPVLTNHETAKGIVKALQHCPKFKIFTTGETFEFQDLEIHPFSIQHDALDPVGFTLRYDDLKIGFCTDIGFVTSLVRNQLQKCHYLYVEANHEPSMVHACPRPMIYKQRVLGRSGHLSNEACGELLNDVIHPELRHVHLAHLSTECNSPEAALKVITEKLEGQGNRVAMTVVSPKKVGTSISLLNFMLPSDK